MVLYWTKEEARQFVVNYQLINHTSQLTIEEVFNRIKMIQMDPLNVVGTNPELVLQSRIDHFKKEDLNHALYQERYLIDGWDRQMSIYQSDFFSYYNRIRVLHSQKMIESAKHHLDIDVTDYFDEVLKRINNGAPILSSQIILGDSIKHQGGSVKPSKIALDILFHQGRIGVSSRKGNQKKYDLIERLIPYHQEDYFLKEEAFIEWYLYRRIQTCGLAWRRSQVQFQGYYINKKSLRYRYLDVLLEKELIVEVHIEGIDDVFFIPKKALDYPISLDDRISFIAPLDNLIWDRDLLKLLFNFDYLWEVYVPKNKRKYGYYVLPILRGSTFIGRIEFENHKKIEPLKIISIQYEDHVKQTKSLNLKLKQALERFEKYLVAKSIID